MASLCSWRIAMMSSSSLHGIAPNSTANFQASLFSAISSSQLRICIPLHIVESSCISTSVPNSSTTWSSGSPVFPSPEVSPRPTTSPAMNFLPSVSPVTRSSSCASIFVISIVPSYSFCTSLAFPLPSTSTCSGLLIFLLVPSNWWSVVAAPAPCSCSSWPHLAPSSAFTPACCPWLPSSPVAPCTPPQSRCAIASPPPTASSSLR
ncbi:hypothetical protein AAHE18_16G214500 [Arachis hypogaea]